MYCIYMILQVSIRRSERTGTYIFIIPCVVLLLLTYIYMYCIYMILQVSIRRSERTGTYIYALYLALYYCFSRIYVLYIHDTAGKHKAK